MSSAEISVTTTNPSTVVPNGWTPEVVERLGNIVNGDKVAGTQEVNSLGGIEGICSLLKTDIKSGLSSTEIATGTRRRIFGENRLPPPPSKSLLSLMIEALGETIIILLLIAAVVSWILGVFVKQEEDAWLEPVAIFVAVGIVVIAGSVNDFQKERQFRKLNEKQGEKEVSVIRDGQQVRISVFDVVVGDVVVLSVGDILSVDGVFINGNNLKLDESSATGEPDLILKSDTEPILMSGTKVKDGAGRFIVVSVGVNSFSGKIAISLRKDRGDTPLQRRLAVLANDIGKVGLAAATVTVLALIIKLGLTGGFQEEPGEIADKIIDYIITAITIVVLAVPEGLPLAVTISLAYAVLKMLQDNNLVRQLQASETMGSCTTVCSDKTGTLTQNRMTVVAGWIAESSFDQQSEIQTLKLSDAVKNLLIEGISVNTAAYETKKVINGVEVAEKQGSPTEWAQLTLVRELGADFMAIRHKYEEATVHFYPFSSALKRMATVIRREDGTVRVCSTGASEIILAECTHWVDAGGEVKEFDEAQRSLLQSVINKFASNALRTLMLAYRDIPEGESPDYEERQDVRLTMIGLVGIQDPLRPEVAQAVRDCQGAGIKVRMVTGDNATTAKNIAKNAGIWRYDDEVVLEGPVFREMSDEDLDKILPKLTILARSAPLDKQRLVERLKANHAVVAVTGDGTNDAPALQQADVGFAMNIAGTDVAKEAAAIILMDDNFASIVSAVSWGRNVFDAIRKFVQFQLTVNVAAVSLAFIGSLTDDEGESPLKPVQLLWLNLIMDTLGALALATGSPEPEMLTRPPVRPDDKLITRTMWINILGQSFFQLLVECYVLYFGFNLFGLEERSDEHLTLFFSVFVSLQVFNQINCRKVHGELNVFKGIRGNRIFVVILFAIIIIQVLMVEFGAEFIGTVGLTIEEWIFVVILGSLSLPIYLLLRFVVPDQDLNKERAFADKKAKELERTASQPSSPDIVATPRGPKRGWDRARDVRTEIAVINAFRRYRI